MPNETTMTIDERRKYLLIMRQRYVLAERPVRSQLLDEMTQVTALHRKSLLRLLTGELTRQPRTHERARTYGAPVAAALRVIAESFDYLCAERLTPNLGWMARQLVQHGELTVTDEVLAQLEVISTLTVQRLLDHIRQDERRLPQKGPERANQILREVPMTRIAWDMAEPGHFETDLVHHGGRDARGEYVHTLQMIDVATGWRERMAVLGRGYAGMQAAFRRGLARLPFTVREIHPDNGSEFFNQRLLRFWREVVRGVSLSRSRPYQKNDNRNVEQKNSSLVRAYLGFARLDSGAQTLALNELYDQMWLYYNLFQPVMRLVEKTLVVAAADDRPHVQRRYAAAQTPFERLCATQAILPDRRTKLERLRDATNPRRLRRDIYDRLEQLWTLPGATAGGVEDVPALLAAIAQPAPALL